MLYNFLSGALAAILEGGKVAEHIVRVASRVVEGGLTLLQYADDTLILIKNDHVAIVNFMFLLMRFKAMSGIKINFYKSETKVTGGVES